MSFDVTGISSTLGLNTDPFAQGMLRANAIAAVFPQTVTNFMANPLLGVIDLAKKAASAITGIFTDVAAEGDNMGDLAASIGVAVDQLTAMGHVATLAGSNVEGVADAYRFLGKNIGEAMQDSSGSVAKAFARMGVAAVDATGKSRPLEEVMLDVADAIARMPEGAERTNAAMELLGRSGTAMVPMFAGGSRAIREQMDLMRRYGAVVSQEAMASADAWQDGMGEMQLARRGLQRAIAEPLIDALLPYLQKLLAWTRENQPIIRERIESVFTTVGKAVEWVEAPVNLFKTHFRSIASVAGGAAAYMAGPAVVGAITMIGPALLAVINPINTVKIAVASLMIVVNPLAGITNLVRLGLAALTATAIMAPEKLGPLRNAFTVVSQAAQRLYAVFQERIVPVIGRAMTEALAKLQPYLPTTAQVMDVLHASIDRLATFVEFRVIPVIRDGLSRAFDWIGSRLPAVGATFRALFETMLKFQEWVWGTAIPTIGGALVTAWGAVSQAIAAVTPYVQSAYAVMVDIGNWIRNVGVPVLERELANAWEVIGPILKSVEGYYTMMWNDVMKPFFAWIKDTAVPAVGEYLATAWKVMGPILGGVGKVLYGLYQIWLSFLGWVSPAIDLFTENIRVQARVIGWLWRNAVEPFVSWVWRTVKPIMIWIGEQIGWVVGLIGDALSKLAELIKKSKDLPKAAANMASSVPGTAPWAFNKAREWWSGGNESSPPGDAAAPVPGLPTNPAVPVVPAPAPATPQVNLTLPPPPVAPSMPPAPVAPPPALPTQKPPEIGDLLSGLNAALDDLKRGAAEPGGVIAGDKQPPPQPPRPEPVPAVNAGIVEATARASAEMTSRIDRIGESVERMLEKVAGLLRDIEKKTAPPTPRRI